MNSKLRILGIAFLTIVTTLSSCKKDGDKFFIPVVNQKYIDGKVTTNQNQIKVELAIMVASDKFKPLAYKVINYHGYKAIAIQYSHHTDMTTDDDDDSYKMEYNFEIVNDFKDEAGNTIKWKKDDSIRIMPINENDVDIFKGLDTYFKERMVYFENETATGFSLNDFNKHWNYHNPFNKVREFKDEYPDIIIEGSKEAEAYQKKYNKKPRIIKGDIVLGIKL